MNQNVYREYLAILREEIVPALGCTEPIAIAYAAAKARSVLGRLPEHIDVRCSGNIIKNVKAVIVPTTGNMKGIETSAVLGAVAALRLPARFVSLKTLLMALMSVGLGSLLYVGTPYVGVALVGQIVLGVAWGVVNLSLIHI